ncbi:ABC transporter permease [Thalassobacillus sp. C254]|uniref:ABC transporter permease n=1 Tax=Thalassobacillus sp. C254 TaxID=1225341 RepID=UPI000AAC36CF|nr:ABC transporter permease [Thalassobacillus sp. C254]
MTRFIVSRLLQTGLVLFILTVITFILMKLAPGDPVRSILRVEEVAITREQEEALRNELLLDQPFLQYFAWLKGIFQFDLGTSHSLNVPVIEVLLGRLPNTLLLTAGGLLVMMVIACVLGVGSAYFYNRPFDHISRIFALLGASLPSFWLGLLLIQWFSLHLGWLLHQGAAAFCTLSCPLLR